MCWLKFDFISEIKKDMLVNKYCINTYSLLKCYMMIFIWSFLYISTWNVQSNRKSQWFCVLHSLWRNGIYNPIYVNKIFYSLNFYFVIWFNVHQILHVRNIGSCWEYINWIGECKTMCENFYKFNLWR